MKKIALYGLLALGLGFASCDDYKEPNPPAQYNPQESILKTDEVVVASAVTSDTYSLEALDQSNTDIVLATINCSTLPASYEFGAEAWVSANDFATSVPVTATVLPAEEDNVCTVVVSPDDLQGAYYQGISKGPKAKEIKARFLLTTVTGSQVAYVGGNQNYYGPYTFTVLPFPSELVIEDNYYLVGTIDDWSVAGAVKLSHSDLSPYDDPVFSVVFDVPADVAASGWWWKIIPQSTYETGDWVSEDYGQYGVAENGDDAASGILVPYKDGVEPGAGCFKEQGRWMLTVNMEEGTYEFTSAVEFLYTPGDANGWSQTASMLLSTTDFTVYTGYALLSGGFKFTTAPDWNGVNYGAGELEGTLSTDGGAGNLSVPEAGLYWCNVRPTSLSYTVTHVSTIGVIGDATPAGWDASTPLTTADNVIWTGTIDFKGGEFKFRANDGWDINLGGDSYANLTQDGANLPSPGEGTYVVTLNLGQLPYSCTLTKK